MIYGLISCRILTGRWLDLYGWILSIYIEKLRKRRGCATRARAAAAGRAVAVAWLWRADGRDSTGVVLPLNPHNYGSYSLLCWRRLHCGSFRLLPSSLSFCVRTPSPSLGLLLSLFASPRWAYIPSSSVSHSSWLPPHIQLLSGSPRPSSCEHGSRESSPYETESSLRSSPQVKGGIRFFGSDYMTVDRSTILSSS